MYALRLIEELPGRRFRLELEGVAMMRQLFLTIIRNDVSGAVAAFGGLIGYPAD